MRKFSNARVSQTFQEDCKFPVRSPLATCRFFFLNRKFNDFRKIKTDAQGPLLRNCPPAITRLALVRNASLG